MQNMKQLATARFENKQADVGCLYVVPQAARRLLQGSKK